MNIENEFKWKHFQPEIILLCVRWYLKYPLSYEDLVEMMDERGLALTHTTIMRWVHQYAPEIDKRIRPKLSKTGDSWKVDETYVKVAGKWTYLYRAVDKEGNTLDFYLSEFRDSIAAATFLKKALDSEHTTLPRVIHVDKAPSYPVAVEMAKDAGYLPECMELRQIKYLNNRVEADHYPIKRLINPGSGFGSFEGAKKTIRGYEAMRMAFRWSDHGWQVTVRLQEIKMNLYIEWLCIASNMQGTDAWVGTAIKFVILPDGSKAKLLFSQEGYRSSPCKEICTDGWRFVLGESLKSYLETGRGRAYQSLPADDYIGR